MILAFYTLQVFFFFNCLHSKSLLVTQFLKPDTQTPEPHTKSAKPILGLWLSFQCHKTIFAKHNTQFFICNKNLPGINIMAKVLISNISKHLFGDVLLKSGLYKNDMN